VVFTLLSGLLLARFMPAREQLEEAVLIPAH